MQKEFLKSNKLSATKLDKKRDVNQNLNKTFDNFGIDEKLSNLNNSKHCTPKKNESLLNISLADSGRSK